MTSCNMYRESKAANPIPLCHRRCNGHHRCQWRHTSHFGRSWQQWWAVSGRPPRSKVPPSCLECSRAVAFHPESRLKSICHPWKQDEKTCYYKYSLGAKMNRRVICAERLNARWLSLLWDGKQWLWQNRCAESNRDTPSWICAIIGLFYPWKKRAGKSSTLTQK